MLALGNQGTGIKLTKVSPYLQYFIFTIDDLLTNSK
jgi:hypothetical protein